MTRIPTDDPTQQTWRDKPPEKRMICWLDFGDHGSYNFTWDRMGEMFDRLEYDEQHALVEYLRERIVE